MRGRAARDRSFDPAGLPGLGHCAAFRVDPGEASADTIEGLSRSDRCSMGRAALLRCLLRSMLAREETWPRIRFSRLSAPGLKTTLNRSSFRSIPFSETSSAFLRSLAPAAGGRGCLCGAFRFGFSPVWAVREPRKQQTRRQLDRLERHGVGLRTETLPREQYWRTMWMEAVAAGETAGSKPLLGQQPVGRSTNGRSSAFGALCLGSNPSRPATLFRCTVPRSVCRGCSQAVARASILRLAEQPTQTSLGGS